MKRRSVLWLGLGTTAALVVGWGVLPPAGRLRRGDEKSSAAEIEPNAWLRIAADGSVTVLLARCEMGQGAHTAIAMLVAEELDVPLESLRLENAPIDPVYNNISVATDGLPFHPDDHGMLKRQAERLTGKVVRRFGVMVTGGSTTVRDLWQPLREAGAMARATLIEVAARDWGVSPQSCRVERGVVIDAQERRKTFGELVAVHGNAWPEPSSWRTKPATDYRLIGRPLPRVASESLAKVTGQTRYTLDVQEPGMLFAALEVSPYRDGTLVIANESAVRGVAGVVEVLRVPAMVGAAPALAVVAERHWRAQMARDELVCQWVAGPGGLIDDAQISAELERALAAPKPRRYRNVGDVDAVFALDDSETASRSLTARYSVPFLAHAAMEPLSCAVKFEGNRATVWAGVQIPDAARKAAARALELDERDVVFDNLQIGGAFGRRLDADFVAQAAYIARRFEGRLVQVFWRREDDMRQDFYRPAAAAELRARLDGQGQIIAWQAVSAGQSIVAQALGRLFGLPGGGPDKTTVEGAFDQPYEFANHRVAHQAVELPVAVGFWRSVGHSQQAFFTETFMDELARLAKQDPLEFRLRHLRFHPRHAAVLRLAAEKAAWDQPAGFAADGAPIARGIALNESFGSIVAEVVELSLSAEGSPRVHRVVVAIDCGVAVNPNLIAQQMESAVIYGLSAALYGEINFVEGAVRQSNFDDYRVLRLAETPAIETHIVPSAEPPGGVGEPGLPPLAPALANALAVLSGKPQRRLPLIGA